MKKALYFCSVLATLMALVLICAAGSFAQDSHKKSGSMTISSAGGHAVDLTKTAESECTESVRREAGDSHVVVKYQRAYKIEAEKTADKLTAVIIEMQKLLKPLKVGNTHLYLLHMDQPPANYKINLFVGDKVTFVNIMPFKEIKELNLEACEGNNFCNDIFKITPHEMTHKVLDGLITRDKTRWFDDGMAEYVGYTELEKFAPDLYKKDIEGIIPAIFLNRDDIRENLFSWKEPDRKIFKMNQGDMLNEYFKYRAAYWLIKQIVLESEKKGIENPLGILLTKLKEHRETTGKPASTEDIISIIQQNLKVDPRRIGKLDVQTQQSCVDKAILSLSQADLSDEKKISAIYILANINEIKLSDKWINYLLDQVYKSKASDDNQRDIVATSLVVRFNQTGFDELLEKYLSINPQLKQKSVKKAKADLAKLSLRPRPD